MSEENKNSNLKPSAPVPPKPNSYTNPAFKPNIKAVETKRVGDNVKADNKKDKDKRRRLLLLLLLLLLIFIGTAVGVFFIVRTPDRAINFKLEVISDIQTEINNSDGSVSTIKYLPGDTMDAKFFLKVININGINYSQKVFLRFKINVEVDGNSYSGFFEPYFNNLEGWTYGTEDDYYYYNFRCVGNENIEVFDYLNFIPDRDNNALNGKEAKLIFIVEILEGNYSAINQMWITAPTNWRLKVK